MNYFEDIHRNGPISQMIAKLGKLNGQVQEPDPVHGQLIRITVLTAKTLSTYTVPDGINALLVQIQGAGGGGGDVAGAVGNVAAGSGGAGGAYGELFIDGLAASYSYRCGTGGPNGSAGTDTLFGTLDAAAGLAGSSLAAGTTMAGRTGGFGGGTVVNASFAVDGDDGGFAHRFSATYGFSGNGGGSRMGGQTRPRITSGNGFDASGYGAGGGGAFAVNTASAYTGGVGSDGIIIVWEFS